MSRKRIFWTLAGIAAAVLLVWQFHHSPEWRRFSWTAVWNATRAAQGWWIAGSIVLIYISYLIRTWRWQLLMSPHGRFWPVWKGTVIGFTGTALLGRPGELVRPYYIARKHGSQLSPQLAVWLLERTFDMAGVVLLVGLFLAFDPGLKALTHDSTYQHAFQKAGMLASIFVIVVLGLMYWFHRRSAAALAWLRQRQKRHPAKFRTKIISFAETLATGTSGLTRGRTLLGAIGYTLLLWFEISLAFWMAVVAYPNMLPGFNIADGVLLMGLTAVGSVVQLPAVGGGFQVLTIFGLVQIFGAEPAAATSSALLIWLIAIYAITPLGAILTTHEGVSWRGLEQEAKRAEEGDAPEAGDARPGTATSSVAARPIRTRMERGEQGEN
jgi:uncharacterized membrane protein YbhN (UPF0104 family)